jgi:homoserine kinase type II
MAVYTEVPDDALRAFLASYRIGTLIACKGIAEGVENSNFLLRASGGDFILTLYEKRVEVAELPYFLGLMEHLAERGINCPRPVADRDGSRLRRLCGRAAAITTFLPGVWPRDIRVGHCAELGAALAALHRAGEGYAPERANALGPAGWAPLLARGRAHPGAAGLPAGLLDELEAALRRVLSAWPAPGLPRGHIHADLFPDNVFFLEDRLSGLIDFYFAATDLFAYDVAVCLNAWCFDDAARFDPARAAALLGAYDRGRPLLAAERAALPVLCAGAALRFALTRLYDWLATPPGALVTRKDPMDYVTRLRLFLAEGARVLADV